MPRYFLRVREQGTMLPDDGEGQEFASIEDVRHEAIQSAREILSDAVLSGKADTIDQQVVVINEAGEIVLTVSVREAGSSNPAIAR